MSLWLNKKEKDLLLRLVGDADYDCCSILTREEYECEGYCDKCGYYLMREKLKKKIESLKV